MNLCYTLPAREAELLKEYTKKKLIYCVPYEISSDGRITDNAYCCVTEDAVIFFQDGLAERAVPLSACSAARCASAVDNGQLILTIDGEETICARTGMAGIAQMAYVAKGISALIAGKTPRVQASGEELRCPTCARVLPGTRQCPYCGGKKRALRRILTLIKPYKRQFIWVLSLMLIITALSVGTRFAERALVDGVLTNPEGTFAQAMVYLALEAALIAGVIVCYILRNRASTSLGSRISLDLREQLYQKVQQLSIAYLSKRKPGELMNRMLSDTVQIRQFMENTFAVAFNQALVMVFSVIVMLVMDWRLTLIVIAFFPLVFIMAAWSRGFFSRIYARQWRKMDETNSRLQDVLSGIRVVKAFGMEQHETEMFRQTNRQVAALQQQNETAWSTITPIFGFVFGLGSVAVTLYGGLGILGGTFTPGEMVMFTYYVAALYGPIQFMGNLPRVLVQTMTSLERIYDVLEEPEDIAQHEKAVSAGIEGNISIQAVSFGYKSYEPVLENISLEVAKGEMIGLVGSSGAGKSTLINLLMRMYDVDEGAILIDGVDLRDYDKAYLHSSIGVVLQESFLFSGTVLENIRYSKPDASPEEVIRAAKLANAHDFIVKFPDGYDTKVGENGQNLSGGERQRVAIARAILHDPKILILDEATSALDTETEYCIQEALSRLIKGRTTFAIAHRLSTLRNADRIMVIHEHTCAEIGTHTELMKKKGIYYGLVMAQLQMGKIPQ